MNSNLKVFAIILLQNNCFNSLNRKTFISTTFKTMFNVKINYTKPFCVGVSKGLGITVVASSSKLPDYLCQVMATVLVRDDVTIIGV